MARSDGYPDLYNKSEIYDPDVNVGGTVPVKGSIVVDDNGILQYVQSVDAITGKSTLDYTRTKMLSIDNAAVDTDAVSLVNYSNTMFYCYFDISNTPTRLTIDKKFLTFGKLARWYRLIKLTNNNQAGYDVISKNYSVTGDDLGEFIPMLISDEDAYIRTCAPCYTNFTLSDGDAIFIEVYDENKTLISNAVLYCKPIRSLVFRSSSRMITGMDLAGTQIIDAETFYLHPNQDPSILVLTPQLKYNDGSLVSYGVDNTNMYLFGLDDFVAAYPGQETTIILKYFLKDTDTVSPLVTENGIITIEKKIKVISDVTDSYTIKISVIPRYDPANSKYVLFFYMYMMERNTPFDVTGLVDVISEFDGNNYNDFQTVVFRLNLNSVINVGSDEIFTQSVMIKLNPITYYERYILKDNENDPYGIYGVEGGIYRRPVIEYNSSTKLYKIPSDIFGSVEYFLEQFYYKGRPLFDTTQSTEPKTPTHFTVRDIVNGNLLLSNPISISEYYSSWAMVDPVSYAGQNVIVEFLDNTSGTFKSIFGFPVDIRLG